MNITALIYDELLQVLRFVILFYLPKKRNLDVKRMSSRCPICSYVLHIYYIYWITFLKD